jgi:hypothetical protein
VKTRNKIFAVGFCCAVFFTSVAAQNSPAVLDTAAVSRTIRTVIAATHHSRMKWPDLPYYKDEMASTSSPRNTFCRIWCARVSRKIVCTK